MKRAIIIGAGPAGLTAAYELLKETNIKPIILEMTDEIGGISQTKNFNGNRMDLGGHRFFSKSSEVMNMWQEILPVLESTTKDEKVFLVRHRLSRILFLRKFFDYPISLNWKLIKNLGFIRMCKMGMSYLRILIAPPRNIDSLEAFYISRFGKELYDTFFKDYTEKVWGVPCSQISPEWGAQRVKGLSVAKTLLHAIKQVFKNDQSISQKNTETSLIERFIYPKHGPGQLWEEVATRVKQGGGEIRMECKVTAINYQKGQVTSVTVRSKDGAEEIIKGDYFISSMPVKELVAAMGERVPQNVKEVANGLVYRDFMTVGLLLKDLKLKDPGAEDGTVKDNWIYVQEKDVKLGRIQLFHNWSPYMIRNTKQKFIGLEYFCNEGDAMWSMPDGAFLKFAVDELIKLGIVEQEDVLEGHVVHVKKAYPAYWGTYERMSELISYMDTLSNLYLVGRNGQHRYNNMDHSMLTAMEAVKNIRTGKMTKDNVWNVNTEAEYHETKEEEVKVAIS